MGALPTQAGGPPARGAGRRLGGPTQVSRTGRCWIGGSPHCSSERRRTGPEHNERVTSLVLPIAVLSRARRATEAFHALTGVAVNAAELLAGRAGLLGLSPHGRISAGGATRPMRGTEALCARPFSRHDGGSHLPP